MKRSYKAQGAVCAALVGTLLAGGMCMGTMPGIACAETLVASSEAETATITFAEDGVTVAGDATNITCKGTDVTISAAGTYVFGGACSNGSINVKKGTDGVTIVLRDLTLAKDGDKAIKFKAGSTGTIVVEGTNSLSVSGDKAVIKANAAADDNDAVILDATGHATGGSLTLMGTGTLNLTSDYSETVDGELEGCDAVNCEGDLTVLSGTYNIHVTDDALHAENTLTIGSATEAGPTINVASALEGLEGASVRLLSGTGTIHTTDDGINAANADLVSYGWRYAITVEGGSWHVVAGGDAIDSNGDLTFAGGVTEAYCTGSGNGALDYGEGMEGEVRGTFQVCGGTLFAVGSEMSVTPTSGTYAVFGAGGMGGGPGMGGAPDAGGAPGMGGRGQQMGQGGQAGDPQLAAQAEGGFAQGQAPAGQAGAQGRSSVVVAGAQTTVTDEAGTALFDTVADAAGSYALFASAEVTDASGLTLTSGEVTSAAGTGAGFGQMGPGAAGGGFQQNGGAGQSGTASAGTETASSDYTDYTDYTDYSDYYSLLGSVGSTYSSSSYGSSSSSSSSTSSTSSNVRRMSGSTRYDTMAQVVSAGFTSSEWAVVASGEGFADALAASALAGAHDCPVILTAQGSLSAQARSELQSLGVRHVVIVGGPAAVSSAVESEIAALVGDVSRIWGQDRYQTSLAVLSAVRAADASSDTVIVATGSSFADALSMGPWAWRKAAPIVLVGQGQALGSEAVSAIKAAGFSKAVIVGGAAAVSGSVETQLAGLSVTRLAGADRYETSQRIAEWACGSGLSWSKVALATGENFPDALAASATFGSFGSPVLLVSGANTSAVNVCATHASSISGAYVLGGSSAVSDAVETSLGKVLS